MSAYFFPMFDVGGRLRRRLLQNDFVALPEDFFDGLISLTTL